jgi:peptide/nickel transport system substrate-binding protein
VVSFLNGKGGISVRNASGGGHYPFVMRSNKAPFDNYDLRMALKLAINREEMVDKVLRGFGSIGNDFPINASYPLFSDDIEQRVYDPDKAAFHYRKSGVDSPIILQVSEITFPGAVDAAQLFQENANAAGIPLKVKREPGDGYWSEIWNKQPFCGSYWAGQPTQDEQYSIAYLSGAEWNETKFDNPAFDKLILEARSELNSAKRKSMYRDAATLVRDDGGVILPMFNDFVDATGPRIQGWINDPNAEMMNHQVLTKCWLGS